MNMTTAEIRVKLHEYVETTDDTKVEALYTLLLQDAEERADIDALDRASGRKHEFIPLEDGLKQIEALRDKA